jgi:hypothetical protein
MARRGTCDKYHEQHLVMSRLLGTPPTILCVCVCHMRCMILGLWQHVYAAIVPAAMSSSAADHLCSLFFCTVLVQLLLGPDSAGMGTFATATRTCLGQWARERHYLCGCNCTTMCSPLAFSRQLALLPRSDAQYDTHTFSAILIKADQL